MAKRSAASDLNKDNWDHDEESEEMGVFQKASDEELKSRKIRRGKRTIGALGSVDTEDKPSVFKNFNAFGSSATSVAPTFSFTTSKTSADQKKLEMPAPTFNFSKPTESNSPTNGSSKPSSPESLSMFQFKSGANDAKPKKTSDSAVPKSSFFSFSGTTTSKDSDKPTADLIKDSTNKVATAITKNTLDFSFKQSSNSDKVSNPLLRGTSSKETNSETQSNKFYNDLRALNESVLDFIKTNLEKNKLINLNPIFESYKTNYDQLQKSSETTTKSTLETPSSLFSSSNSPVEKNSESAQDLPKSTFSFGSGALQSNNKPSGFSFSSKTTDTAGFSFSKANENFSFGSGGNKPSTGGFSFGGATGGATGFSFGGSTKPAESQSLAEEESDEPPKVEVTEVKEDDAIYEKKVKLFYKKDGSYAEKGIGTLFLKPAGEKVQLIVRALTNLGNILLNVILNESLPTQRVGKNNVLLVCVPNPPVDTSNPSTPVSMLIRVKTGDDADELLKKIDDNKKC